MGFSVRDHCRADRNTASLNRHSVDSLYYVQATKTHIPYSLDIGIVCVNIVRNAFRRLQLNGRVGTAAKGVMATRRFLFIRLFSQSIAEPPKVIASRLMPTKRPNYIFRYDVLHAFRQALVSLSRAHTHL